MCILSTSIQTSYLKQTANVISTNPNRLPLEADICLFTRALLAYLNALKGLQPNPFAQYLIVSLGPVDIQKQK